MVMPSMPASSSASLTASSLEGWRTASILSICKMPRLTAYQAERGAGRNPPKVFSGPGTRLDHRSGIEVVAFLAVLGEIEAGGFVFGRDAQADDPVNDEEQNQRAHDGDAPGNGDSAELVEELPPVAVDGAGGDVLAVDGVDGAGGEEPREQCAQGSASAMHAEGIERVIVAEHALYLEDHKGAEEAGDDADEQGREGLNEPRGGGDGDQAGDRAGDGAERGGLAVVEPLEDRPANGGSGGGEVGVYEGAGGQGAGGQSAAGVEAEPAYPQQASSDEAEHHGVRGHVGLGIADALAEVDAGDQGGDAASDVDYGATGKIEAGNVAASGVEQSANAPHHVGHGTVNKNGPEGKIERHGAELHALGKGAGDEGRGNDGEHELVDHVGLFGNRGGVIGIGGKADAAQEKMLKAADEGAAVAKGQRVTADSPNDGDQAHHGEALHHGAQDVLLAHEAAVEESESGAGHEQDQGGGDQHPCVVASGLGILDGLLKGSNLRLRHRGLSGGGCGS